MKRLIIAAMVISLFATCKKHGIEFDKQYIRGRLFRLDTISGAKEPVPLAKAKVLLSQEGDTLDFLYSTSTNDDGYFSFTLLSDEGNIFTLRTSDTVDSVYFSALLNVSRGDKDVVLITKPDENKQNGLILFTTDQSGSLLPKVKISIYSNQSLAASNQPSLAVATLETDYYGKGWKIGRIPAGDYYINAEKQEGSITYRRLLKHVTLNATGFVTDTINLALLFAANGFEVFLKDTLGDILPQADVRLYNNQLLAQSNGSGYINSFTSDSMGKVFKYNLSPGTHYLNAIKISGSDTFTRVAKPVVISAAGIIRDTMLLNRVYPTYFNGLTVQAKDSLHSPMPFTQFKLYNSQVLAAANDTSGAIEIATSDSWGSWTKHNLPAGTYYLNATKKVNDTLTYERLAKSFFILGSGYVTDTVELRRKM